MFTDSGRPLTQVSHNYLFFGGDGGGGYPYHWPPYWRGYCTHITSEMRAGLHISQGYTYHCDRGGSIEKMTAIRRVRLKKNGKLRGRSASKLTQFVFHSDLLFAIRHSISHVYEVVIMHLSMLSRWGGGRA